MGCDWICAASKRPCWAGSTYPNANNADERSVNGRGIFVGLARVRLGSSVFVIDLYGITVVVLIVVLIVVVTRQLQIGKGLQQRRRRPRHQVPVLSL